MTAERKSSVSQPTRPKSTSRTGSNRGKKKKSDRSKMSEKSRASQQKSVQKSLQKSQQKSTKASPGLSPPKSKQLSTTVKTTDRATEPSDHEIDQTQWEFSRYKDESKGIVDEDPNTHVVDKVGEATPFLAEQKQKMLIRGEHLKEKPWYTLFFLFVQIILALTVLIAWSFSIEHNETLPIIFCFSNVIIVLIIVLLIFAIQLGRFNVIEEELNEDVRYRIPYEWKYWICMMHILCFFLTCANITIAALDDDFDRGVITMVAGMPVMLIIAAGHVFFALRPQG